MTEQEELHELLLKLGSTMTGWGDLTFQGGDLTLWHWSTGAMVLSGSVMEPPGSDRVNVMTIDGEGRIAATSPGMISWALHRVRRHMILESLADV